MSLTLPVGNFKAYLFDCDGTVVDSMPQHLIAWRRSLAGWNSTITDDQFYGWGGLPTTRVVELLNEEQGLSMPIYQVIEQKEVYYYEMLEQLKPVDDVVEHVLEAHGRIPIAVVSGSTRESVEASLKTVGLRDRFQVLVCAGEYTKGKPHPEPFLKAAELLGVAPEDCLVFEDAEPGIQSAIAAGMAWVRIPQPREREMGVSR